MESMYNILEELRSVFLELEENGGEITEELKGRLDAISTTVEAKIENCGLYIKSLQSEMKAIDEEIERLHARKKSREKTVGFIKRLILNGFEMAGLTKIKTPLITIWKSRAQNTVSIDDETVVPLDYKIAVYTDYAKNLPLEYREKSVIKVNNSVLKEALEKGTEIPGASLNPGTEYVCLR